ncbi:MAG: adenine phosphoribosyltransferase, partial [Neisseriaceae bacterium]|nr:adenine phosphoribosyltransferase [Neisseriaceae bacterium]
MTAEIIHHAIRKIPDYPQKGILFYDITTVLNNPQAFRVAIDLIVDYAKSHHIDCVAGLEARGFILGAAVAYRWNVGFVTIRKKGKLPSAVFCEDYALEYGTASVEIHQDALGGSQTVLLCDDLI